MLTHEVLTMNRQLRSVRTSAYAITLTLFLLGLLFVKLGATFFVFSMVASVVGQLCAVSVLNTLIRKTDK